MKANKLLKTRLSVFVLLIVSIITINTAKADIFYNNDTIKGEGTKTNPFKISSTKNLKTLSLYVNNGEQTATISSFYRYGNGHGHGNIYYDYDESYYFELTTDLDFSQEGNFTSIGSYSNPFMGRFIGNGHKISNIQIIDNYYTNHSIYDYFNPTNHSYIGLFGCISKNIHGTQEADTAAVIGLGIENATIEGYSNVGGIVGYADNCTIKDCYVSNSTIKADYYTEDWYLIRNKEDHANVGGIIGTMGDGVDVSFCYTTNDTIKGQNYVGGIFGYDNEGGRIGNANTYNNYVSNCYSTSTIKSRGYFLGPIGGGNERVNNETDCYYKEGWNYYNINAENDDLTYGGTSQTTQELREKAHELLVEQGTDYVEDLFNVNDGYPILVGQNLGLADYNVNNGSEIEIPATYNGDLPDTIILESGATLINNSNRSIRAKVKTKLFVNNWNLYGSILTTNIFGVLNNNYGDTTSLSHDMVAVTFDYTTNQWNSTYAYAADSLDVMNGVFVFPLATDIAGNEIRTDRYVYVEQTGTLFDKDTIKDVENTFTTVGNVSKWASLNNPYTANLSITQFVNDNNLTEGTVFVYNPEYMTIKDNDTIYGKWESNLTGITKIDPARGFIISVGSTAQTGAKVIDKKIKFKKDQLVPANKKEANNDIASSMIRFTAKANRAENTAYVNINQEASNGYDSRDAFAFFSTNNKYLVEPYFVVDDAKILKNEIQAIPYQVPINFHSGSQSDVDFVVDNIPQNVSVSIIDLQNDSAETSLNDGNVFHFVANIGENENRFIIKFASKNVSINDNAVASDVAIWNKNNQVNINGNNLQKVEVLNMLGQTVYAKEISGDSYKFNLLSEQGAYLVKVTTTNKATKIQKIVIK